jgi:acyl-CoA synthetase (AMP-forming)/AMP-acid ligase II
MPPPRTLVDVVDRGARLFGDRLAVVDGETALSYAALRTQVRAMAARLHADGVRPGDVVAVAGQNRVAWVIAAFGASMCGAVVAPLGQNLTDVERAATLAELAAVRVLADEANQSDAELNSPPTEFVPHPDDTALLLATSGTTGKPDYVPMTHGQLVGLYGDVSGRVGLTPDDRIFGVVPLAHSFGFNGVLLAGLLAGACVRLLPDYDRHRAAALVLTERLTVVAGPPTVFYDLAQANVPLGDTCRLAITGSAEVSAVALRATCDQLGIAEVVVGYGLTEAAGTVALDRLHRGSDEVWMTPLTGVDVRIVGDNGAELQVGAVGRILVRGFNVCRRSFHDAAREPSHWLDTGDLGRLDGFGRLVVESRRDDMVVINGFNVYPHEVEAVLLTHPDIAAAAVIGRPDPRRGQVLVAAVVLAAGQANSEADLVAHCRKSLTPLKVPHRVITLAALPLTPTGKVSRSALRRQLDQENTNV